MNAGERRNTVVRYPSDLTDAEWTLIEPMVPPGKRGGHERKVDMLEGLNGIFNVLSMGCQRDALPSDLLPKNTICDQLNLWQWDGTLERIHDALHLAVREQAKRQASPFVGRTLV